MANEKAIKRGVVRALKQLEGAWVYCPSDKFISGIPDVFLLYKGFFIAIELKDPKRPSTTHRKLQGYVRELIIKAGGHATECTSVKDAIKFVEEIVK